MRWTCETPEFLLFFSSLSVFRSAYEAIEALRVKEISLTEGIRKKIKRYFREMRQQSVLDAISITEGCGSLTAAKYLLLQTSIRLEPGELGMLSNHFYNKKMEQLNPAKSMESALQLAKEEKIEIDAPLRQRLEARFRRYAVRESHAGTIYRGSDRQATRKFCRALENHSFSGKIAAELFRCLKASCRAKKYRGGVDVKGYTLSFSTLSYERKNESMKKLCTLLSDSDWAWGWGKDEKAYGPDNVLYIDLPLGQVSFHAVERYHGPNYLGEWDQMRDSENRILMFCCQIWNEIGKQQTLFPAEFSLEK